MECWLTEPAGHSHSHLCILYVGWWEHLHPWHQYTVQIPAPPPPTRELIVKHFPAQYCHCTLTQSFQQHCEIATIILIFIIENQGPEKQSKLPKTATSKRQSPDSSPGTLPVDPNPYSPHLTVSPHLPPYQHMVSISWEMSSRYTMH